MAKAPATQNPETPENAPASSSNLAIWDAVQTTDPKYTKQFQRGGGFRGTSTNATYLARKATEQFGPCGIGWGVKVLDEQLIDGHPFIENGVVVGRVRVHVARVQLWYVRNGQRGEIEQYGQTEMVGKRSSGYYTDEEAPKKSITDGMTKCLSLLGFAADIHLGMYDDNKYVSDLRQRDFSDSSPEPQPQAERPAQRPQRDGGPRMTVDEHVKAINAAQNPAALQKAFALAWKQYENPNDPKVHTPAQLKFKSIYEGAKANFQSGPVGGDGSDNTPVDNFEDALP